jgi:squalene synthase HpnC
VSIDHYENFPVASLLCPQAIRPAVLAIYRFARTADDIADEGTAPGAERLADLQAYRADLDRIAAGQAASPRWPEVFAPLALQMHRHALPPRLLAALLDAFMQDSANPRHADRAALLDYCSRSANPIGRLLLHLYGIGDPESLRRSDAICSALQLINFWQDLSIDLPRGRVYLPAGDAARHGIDLAEPRAISDTPALRALVAELCCWAHGLMQEGAPLALQLPGRIGWELRFVVQGGLAVLDKLQAIDHASVMQRPKLTRLDAPRLAWRALTMGSRLGSPAERLA